MDTYILLGMIFGLIFIVVSRKVSEMMEWVLALFLLVVISSPLLVNILQ